VIFSIGIVVQVGIVTAALTSVLTFTVLVFKTSNTLHGWSQHKFHTVLKNTVGYAVREELNHTNGGTGHGDRMKALASGHVELTQSVKDLDGKVEFGNRMLEGRMGRAEEKLDDISTKIEDHLVDDPS